MNPKTKYNTLTYEEIDKLVGKHFDTHYSDQKSFENDLSYKLEKAKEEVLKGNFITFEDFCNNFKLFCDEKEVEYPLDDRI